MAVQTRPCDHCGRDVPEKESTFVRTATGRIYFCLARNCQIADGLERQAAKNERKGRSAVAEGFRKIRDVLSSPRPQAVSA